MESLKRDLEFGLDYTSMAAFRTVDKYNTGSISTVNMGAFMRENGHYASETELLAIVRRLDTNGDASVTYSELTEFLRASPGVSPTPAPVVRTIPEYIPPPRYYDYPYPYYRYGDYPYYPYYSRYSPYFSRYYPYHSYPSYPYYPRYPLDPLPLPSETVSTSYEVERGPTAYSPSRTVKKTTFHSPYGSRTVKELL